MFKKFAQLVAGKAIKSIKPNVPKTEIQKKIRDLKIGNQKLKSSKAKLDQTIFEVRHNQPITFKKDKGKSESNKEAYKRIQKQNTKTMKSMIDDAFKEKKAKGGRVGLKSGTQLSAKQMKIASLAGNKKKIDGPDFKKLRAMKSPMDKTVRKA